MLVFLHHTSLGEDIDLALFKGIKVRKYLVRGSSKRETSQLEPKVVINNCFRSSREMILFDTN
jgi:hypothetical protein